MRPLLHFSPFLPFSLFLVHSALLFDAPVFIARL